jgi:hypothetical protein
MARDPREYGLTPEDRLHEIDRKFGREQREAVLALLARVRSPSEKLLGAIVFVANPGDLRSVEAQVAQADADPRGYLDAAQVVADRR